MRDTIKTYFIIYSLHLLGRLDSWNVSWAEVEEIRYEIQQFNLDVKILESFSSLERQDAFDHHEELLFLWSIYLELNETVSLTLS